ncbi:MAG: LacI family DNA-binding transcriptional regulator [Roseobacter sp.]
MTSRTKKRPTISDVARLANVSTATVSRALQNPELVSQQTRKTVYDVVAQTGYRANKAAKMLRQNRANTLLVLLPDIANPFFSEILSGIEEVATEHNNTILIGNTNGEDTRTKDLLGNLRNGRADGALLLNGKLPIATDEITSLKLVSISEAISDAPIPHVGTDSVAASREATQHLIDLGHRRVIHFSGQQGNILTEQRIKGYQEAMQTAGLEAYSQVIPCGFTLKNGQAAATRLLKTNIVPDAIVCASDIAAMGAVSEFKSRGLDIPQDLSIVGFDDIDFSGIFSPPLTTIRQSRKEMGQQAARMLLGHINGTLGEPENITVEHRLIQRASAIKKS